MPELPEVEVTRRGIDGPLRGAQVQAVRMGKPLRWPLGVAPEQLLGQRVHSVGRRGKYLLVHLDRGLLIFGCRWRRRSRLARRRPMYRLTHREIHHETHHEMHHEMRRPRHHPMHRQR
jgi:formamidopyrimidine-DNA glycosylase